jgi:hypothetical protein
MGVGDLRLCKQRGQSPSPSGDNNKRVTENFKKNLLLQNQQAKFNQTWYKLSLDEENSSLFK